MTVDGQPTEAIYSSLSQPYRATGPQLFCFDVLGGRRHASAPHTVSSPGSFETLDPKVTHTGVILGTLNYAAPELSLMGSNKATPSSDIFSFGIIAYELLTKSRPYAQPVAQSMMMRVPVGPPTPLTVTQLPPALRALIEKCVSVEPKHRPSDAASCAALSTHQATLAA